MYHYPPSQRRPARYKGRLQNRSLSPVSSRPNDGIAGKLYLIQGNVRKLAGTDTGRKI